MRKQFRLLCCAVFIHVTCLAQDTTKNAQVLKDYINSIAKEQYSFNTPGDDFVLMEDQSGYIRNNDKAAIKYQIIMGKPPDFITEVKEAFIKLESGIYDSMTIKTNDGDAFAWWQEEIPQQIAAFRFI